MKMSSALRAALVALVAFAGLSSARADEGFVTLTIYKAGWIIGGSGGSGVLTFHGRAYPLSTGGLDYGLVFGGSKTVLRGRVSNIYRPSDVAGVYGAAGAGLAIGSGARAIVLTNQKGAVLELSGRQTGLMANADLSGLAITLRELVGVQGGRRRSPAVPTIFVGERGSAAVEEGGVVRTVARMSVSDMRGNYPGCRFAHPGYAC